MVKAVLRSRGSVVVEGVNYRHRFVKLHEARIANIPAGAYICESPIHASHVSLLDPVTNKPTQVIKRFSPEGDKVRISKASGHVIPKPEVLKLRKIPRRPVNPDHDTPAAEVLKQTYVAPDYASMFPSLFPKANNTSARS